MVDFNLGKERTTEPRENIIPTPNRHSSFLLVHDGLFCFECCGLAFELFDDEGECLGIHAVVYHADKDLQLLLVEATIQ